MQLYSVRMVLYCHFVWFRSGFFRCIIGTKARKPFPRNTESFFFLSNSFRSVYRCIDWFCNGRKKREDSRLISLPSGNKLMYSRRKWQIKIDVLIEGIIIEFRWAIARAITFKWWQPDNICMFAYLSIEIQEHTLNFEWCISQVWSGFRSNV